MAQPILCRGDVVVRAKAEGSTRFRRRVLYICAPTDRVALFDIDNPHALPEWVSTGEILHSIRVGDLSVDTVDPMPPDQRPDADLSTRRKADRNRWWAVLEPEVYLAPGELDPRIFDEEELRTRVRRMCAVAGTTPNVIRKWMRRWWRYGQERNALLSGFDRSGARGKPKGIVSGRKRGRPKVYLVPGNPGLNITEQQRVLLVRGGIRFHQRGGMSLRDAWQATQEVFFRRSGPEGIEVRSGVPVPILLPAHEMPSFDQFRYWYGKERDARAEYVARHGEKTAVLRRDPKGGTFLDSVPGPGHTYIIDATIGDIYLLSSGEPGRIIGRPVIYVVIDAYSQMVVGLYVGLEGPSWTGAKAALENAFSDKGDFLRDHGFDPEFYPWPCAGICTKITADRGEVLGKASDHAVIAFGLTITNCPAFRPDLKALVEGHFKIANDRVIHWAPGAVYKARDRGEPDYRYDATYTLHQFRRLMIIHVLKHNNAVALRDWVPAGFPILPGGNPTPLDIWEWGMENQMGQLRRYHRDPQIDREWLRINLMREAEGTVSREGIRVHGIRYWSPELGARGWFDRDPPRKRPERVRVAHDDRDMGKAWVRLDGGRQIFELKLHGRHSRYAGNGYYDVVDERALRKLADANGAHEKAQDLAHYNAATSMIATEASMQRDALLGGQKPQLRGMREARAREREAEGSRESGAGVPSPPSPAQKTEKPQGTNVIPITRYLPPPPDLDLP